MPKRKAEEEDNYASIIPNLLDLSADLNVLLRDSIMCDFSLIINEKNIIYCHKDIVKHRSRWFFQKISEVESENKKQILLTESIQILDAVLLYIYTGNLRLLEALDISLLDLHQASKKYGLISLQGVLAPIAKEKEVKEITRAMNFLWTIKVSDYKSVTAECAALNGFSLCGTDKWKMELRSIGSSKDSEPRNGIYITIQTSDQSRRTSHVVKFLASVIDKNKAPRYVFRSHLTLIEDNEYLLTDILTHSEVQKSSDNLIPDGMLTLSCQLSICAKVGYSETFRLEGRHRRSISNELQILSHTMYNVQRCGGTFDLKIKLPSDTLEIHSYICYARCRIHKHNIDELLKKVNLGSIGWSSLVLFMYTGQARYLDDHGRDFYRGLSLTQFHEAKRKYSNYLSKNLTYENAFPILCDAVKFQDDYLLLNAAEFLTHKSDTVKDSEMWIRIARENVNSPYLSFP